MPKTIKSIDEIQPNVFEALKRAYVNRGLVRTPKEPPKSTLQKELEKPSPHTEGRKKPLEKKPPDSKSAKGPENLTELTANSQEVLYEATTVFPFSLFPDTVTLDREKLTIANRTFWRTASVTSTPVGEIMSAESSVGPIFGSLHLTFRFFADNQRSIRFLWRHDATNMQKLIHGYIIANRREIDCSNVPLEELKTMLTELGQGVSD